MPGNTMKSVRKTEAKQGAEMRDADIPTLGQKDVLVRVKATSICGTDLHIYQWNEWAQRRVHPPQTMGHEFTGEVVEIGPRVKSIRVGDYVSAESHIPCGICFQCRTGKAEVCQDVKILGVDVDGCFADYIAIPELNAWKNPAALPLEFASIQEPMGNAVDAVLAEDLAGKTVAILGCGPLGALGVGVARASGATTLIATDVKEFRLELARKLGATHTYNPLETDVVQEIMHVTHGIGVDVVVEMSGNPSALHQAFQMLTPGGRVSLLGLQDRPEVIDLNREIIFKGARVYGITGRKIFSTWFKTARFLDSGLVDLTPIITHRMHLSDYERAMALMMEGSCGKVIMFPDEEA